MYNIIRFQGERIRTLAEPSFLLLRRNCIKIIDLIKKIAVKAMLNLVSGSLKMIDAKVNDKVKFSRDSKVKLNDFRYDSSFIKPAINQIESILKDIKNDILTSSMKNMISAVLRPGNLSGDNFRKLLISEMLNDSEFRENMNNSYFLPYYDLRSRSITVLEGINAINKILDNNFEKKYGEDVVRNVDNDIKFFCACFLLYKAMKSDYVENIIKKTLIDFLNLVGEIDFSSIDDLRSVSASYDLKSKFIGKSIINKLNEACSSSSINIGEISKYFTDKGVSEAILLTYLGGDFLVEEDEISKLTNKKIKAISGAVIFTVEECGVSDNNFVSSFMKNLISLGVSVEDTENLVKDSIRAFNNTLKYNERYRLEAISKISNFVKNKMVCHYISGLKDRKFFDELNLESDGSKYILGKIFNLIHTSLILSRLAKEDSSWWNKDDFSSIEQQQKVIVLGKEDVKAIRDIALSQINGAGSIVRCITPAVDFFDKKIIDALSINPNMITDLLFGNQGASALESESFYLEYNLSLITDLLYEDLFKESNMGIVGLLSKMSNLKNIVESIERHGELATLTTLIKPILNKTFKKIIESIPKTS